MYSTGIRTFRTWVSSHNHYTRAPTQSNEYFLLLERLKRIDLSLAFPKKTFLFTKSHYDCCCLKIADTFNCSFLAFSILLSSSQTRASKNSRTQLAVSTPQKLQIFYYSLSLFLREWERERERERERKKEFINDGSTYGAQIFLYIMLSGCGTNAIQCASKSTLKLSYVYR